MSSANSIPKSDFSFVVKDRVFLFDKTASKFYWSATLEFCLWFKQEETTPQGQNTGDAELEPSVDLSDNITSVELVNNNFYIFKKSASFLFSYQADPENDGYLRKFSNNVGAFDSTLFRNTVVVINNRGIFTVEGTEFIDIQQKLNLRFETPLDNRASNTGFIANMNNMVMVGFKPNASTREHHYVINGANRGWVEWDFSYSTDTLASPGSDGYFTQDSSGSGIIVYTTFDKTRLVYTDWKPLDNIYDYQLDGTKETDTTNGNYTRYIPEVNMQTKTMLGDSILNFKKILRTYIRLYISDLDYSITNTHWEMSINYNDYYFISTNPKYLLKIQAPEDRPNQQVFNKAFEPLSLIPLDPSPKAANQVSTELYRRTYQIPLPMHRVKEYTFQLKRDFTKLVDIIPVNNNPDRTAEAGYYFLLSGIWADYNDRGRI